MPTQKLIRIVVFLSSYDLSLPSYKHNENRPMAGSTPLLYILIYHTKGSGMVFQRWLHH